MGPFDSEPPSGSPPLGAFGASMSVVSVADQHVFLTCGSVLERNLGHRVSAMEWLAHEAEAGTLPDVLFLQEVLPNRLGRLEAIYDLHLAPASPGLPSARTSMLGFRRNLGLVVTDNREVFAALGTYAVCANIELANGSSSLQACTPAQVMWKRPTQSARWQAAEVRTRSMVGRCPFTRCDVSFGCSTADCW